jgi:hypothetical protein
MFTVFVPELKISIQSDASPSSSSNPPWLAARNSLMKTVSAPRAEEIAVNEQGEAKKR